ncbi:unnamed protein product, partial [Musa acuminata subsp. burmannicoides]
VRRYQKYDPALYGQAHHATVRSRRPPLNAQVRSSYWERIATPFQSEHRDRPPQQAEGASQGDPRHPGPNQVVSIPK